ncbi:hypothetical protein HanIR_Chr09g0405521 [Helianthus annuus]|nr:hypothetical protein HanIR_Chr09g0405521 [Helianthus annuus]KAJ0541535.1 hypothetical protein HanHA89_Chr09g0329551 [Helianthus annuus]KAJ0706610.1 hypothetical protein HanLR1_Chr09g0308991 [Helianthus annuus]
MSRPTPNTHSIFIFFVNSKTQDLRSKFKNKCFSRDFKLCFRRFNPGTLFLLHILLLAC